MKKQKGKINKSFIAYSLLFLLSIGVFVFFCISNNNLLTLINIIPTLNILWIVIAAGSMILFWYIDSRIIYHLTLETCSKKYSTLEAFSLCMVGQYFNAITPYNIGGQPMQVVTMTKKGVDPGLACSVFVRKFLIYQITLTLYSAFVIITKFSFFSEQVPRFMTVTLIAFSTQAIVVAALILFSVNKTVTNKVITLIAKLLSKIHIIKKPEETIKNIENQINMYIENNKAMNKKPKLFTKIYALTILELTALFMVPFFIYKAFNNPGFPAFDILSAQTFVTMVSACVPLPGGTGASEGSFFVLFGIFFSQDVIASAMLLWRFITYYSSIIVGAIFVFIANKSSFSFKHQSR